MSVPAISLRQPWLWMTLHAGKDVENRVARSPVAHTKHRGQLLLHASKGKGWAEERRYYDEARWWLEVRGIEQALPPVDELRRGVICGVANLVNVLPPCDAGLQARIRAGAGDWRFTCDRRWHMHEQYGLLLRDARALPEVDYPGALGLFRPAPWALQELGLLP